MSDIPFSPLPFWLEDDVKEVASPSLNFGSMYDKLKITDGIYDIWLRNMDNVKTITMSISGVGIVYYKEELEKSVTEFQIPLAFDTTGQRVDSYFFDKSKQPFHISWIPTPPFRYTDMTIQLNEGASAEVCLSTVFFPKHQRRELSYSNTMFYINGKPMYQDWYKFTDTKPKQMCVVSGLDTLYFAIYFSPVSNADHEHVHLYSSRCSTLLEHSGNKKCIIATQVVHST